MAVNTLTIIHVIEISKNISIAESEVDIQAIRAQGAGGQNVNKVSSAVHLRFDIKNSSLPEVYKERLLTTKDRRLTREGVIVIKAQRFRTQEKNRADALQRLQHFIQLASIVDKKRIATRPTRNSQIRRVDGKAKRGLLKGLRSKVGLE